jgi:hypothetical protein
MTVAASAWGSSRVRARPDWREFVVSAALAASFSALMLAVVPGGGDAAAHLYRTLLVRHGVLVWDNLWFAGQYPLFSYSLFYYLPAAEVGNGSLGVVAVVAAALLFTSILLRQWGSVGRWPSRVFAVVMAGQLFTGAYPYALGFMMLLATIWALQRGRTWLAVVCAALTLGFSPLAFLFLCLALVALATHRRRLDARVVGVAVSIAVLAGFEVSMLIMFPSPGLYYPYEVWKLLLGLGVGVMGAALSFRSRGGWPLASIFLIWAISTIVVYFIPFAVGYNMARPATFALPLVLLAAILADFRPLWLVLPALVTASWVNVVPYLAMIPDRSSEPAASISFWRPAIRFLATHSSPQYRIEVVPTQNHWEAYYLPRAGYALARGWYQQLDVADNPVFYRRPLKPSVYRHWLRSMGVQYVLVPNARLDALAGDEAQLLQSGASDLRKVSVSRSGTIYQLAHASPILTGRALDALTLFNHTEIGGWVKAPGRYLLRVRYTPYWTRATGHVCVRAAANGMTLLVARRRGEFLLRAVENPTDALATALERNPILCAPPPAPALNSTPWDGAQPHA